MVASEFGHERIAFHPSLRSGAIVRGLRQIRCRSAHLKGRRGRRASCETAATASGSIAAAVGLPPSTISSTLDRSTYIERRAAVLVHSVEHRPGVLGLSSFFAAQKPNAAARGALQSGPVSLSHRPKRTGFYEGSSSGARFPWEAFGDRHGRARRCGHGLVDVRLDGLLPFVTTSHLTENNRR